MTFLSDFQVLRIIWRVYFSSDDFIHQFMYCFASTLRVSFFSLKLRAAAQRPVKSVLHRCPLIRLWAPGSAVPSSRVRDGLRLRPTSIGYSSQESTPTIPDQLFWSSFWLLRWQLLYFEEYVWLMSIYLSYRVVSPIRPVTWRLHWTFCIGFDLRTVYKNYFCIYVKVLMNVNVPTDTLLVRKEKSV